jgi:hypothetical protein
MTNFINRNDLQFFKNTTRKKILSTWNRKRKPPVLISESKWTQYEREQFYAERRIRRCD